MKKKINLIFLLISTFYVVSTDAQNISLYKQFNGRYDFVFFGNTLNPEENTNQLSAKINTSAAANLNLGANDVIEKAYLYWAGSGTGDFNIKLNTQNIIPDRKFAFQRTNSLGTFDYFSAFTDVTTQIKTKGNGIYTVSDLDVTSFIDQHFQIKTNFAGWAIIVVYKNDTLPLNQLNVYDGMQAVPDTIDISLSSLNVIDNNNAKIGFLAWEGDQFLAVNESLRINGSVIGNPPLNPITNAFNGTNSFTNSNTLYNMDLDVYNIKDNIKIGDKTANIQLSSGQDFVMINAIVTKLNSQLPDATVKITKIDNTLCNTRTLECDFTVSNLNCTDILPAGTPISIYANGVLLTTTTTNAIIPIDGIELHHIKLTIPIDIPNDFQITIKVDDSGNGIGIVNELIETNNTDQSPISLYVSPLFNLLPELISCNEGLRKGTFNFSTYSDLVKTDPTHTVHFYPSALDAENMTNEIFNTSTYKADITPKEIFVRIDNAHCHSITSFILKTRNCPPTVYNFVSANNDGENDVFFVEGLRDIFVNFKTSIYNRWGELVWSGNNSMPDWNGNCNQGMKIDTSEIPAGTYFYIIELNDPDYDQPLKGYLYLTR